MNKKVEDETDLPTEADSKEELTYRPLEVPRRYNRRSGDVPKQEIGSRIWLISFTDVMALMLTFFVLLYSMSQPEQQNWTEISAALKNEFNRYHGPTAMRGPVEELNLDRIDYDAALNIPYLSALLESTIENNEYLKTVKLISQPGELIVALPQDLLFAPGDAQVGDEGARALYALGGALGRIKNKLEIVGHADPRPLKEQNRYKSNWHLSFARAVNVAALLNAVGYERPIDISGMGSGRYDDLQSVTDEQTRLDLSRRVDIIIKNHDGRKSRQTFMPLVP